MKKSGSEKSTIIGVFLAIAAIGYGFYLKGAPLSALLNPAAALIIFGGTTAAVMIAMPMKDLTKFTKLLKIAFKGQGLANKSELIKGFVNLAQITRREGLLALESEIEKTDDKFFQRGLRMIVDGSDPEFVQDVLSEQIKVTKHRHKAGALIFTQAGTYAPTLGVLGAVVGLIAALADMSEIAHLTHAIAAAFVATLFGIFVGYVLMHPIANKLKRFSEIEMEIKYIMIEGLLSIQEGISTIAIEQKLSVYLTPEELVEYEKAKETKDNGKEA